jgi:hypothetical protein
LRRRAPTSDFKGGYRSSRRPSFSNRGPDEWICPTHPGIEPKFGNLTSLRGCARATSGGEESNPRAMGAGALSDGPLRSHEDTHTHSWWFDASLMLKNQRHALALLGGQVYRVLVEATETMPILPHGILGSGITAGAPWSDYYAFCRHACPENLSPGSVDLKRSAKAFPVEAARSAHRSSRPGVRLHRRGSHSPAEHRDRRHHNDTAPPASWPSGRPRAPP